ncbi:undecaprenyl-diphosphatase [Streptomyces sp. DvalAA-14]|uniref:phosphatase PAP2 family protein n=1 Tax=unclassified Streptomyces TaxID=2593676 RepID=UPI00081B5B89|nr:MULTISPECIES: phosphatase PAP2 family protein [unclassified Streptomyces]MYS24295.1 phosphatase PAP2 family protein [Streptomyces sp. SID4948]SCE44725.1 undecaprenyl-diphosphatase [Streptomyces sp. DvalAA-14]
MAEVANDSVNPDISLLRDMNDYARQAPHGVDRAVELLSAYGLLVVTALLAGWCWWRVARRSADAPAAVAGVLWALLAGGLALLANIPIRAFVRRPRPYTEHDGLDVLIHGGPHYSFVSDQAALAAAIGVGLFMVNRRFGAAALLIAVAEGFTRVYLGAHYPTDVIGGFALGAATTLLLAPLALALLTALTTTLTTTRLAGLIRARPDTLPPAEDAQAPRHRADDKGLAA